MSSLKKIYNKDIEREIQGVIKVDDESYISQELEEYVVTEELLKHFNSFFSSYNTCINGNTEKMGVWISGFFGSGKSHFLKILSYLLENKVVNGKNAVDYFDDKITDSMLLADIKRAGNVSTDIILFNIDSKSENTNGAKDKILDVFEKVFNDKLGLSTTPFVAEIERHIIKEEKYEEFKSTFNNLSNKTWEESRDGIQFYEDEFSEAYAKVLNKTIEEARNIIDKTEKNYSLSVEKFAVRVKEYINTKGDNHNVIFLVDEIGQYIGEDRALMLNLQTIVEDLGLECGGKSWIIVTSQEAIDEVVNVQGNDFSKIQGRFDTKLSLSSSDIDEVIKKRILDKNEESSKALEIIFEKEESVIRNLLTFKNGQTQKIYDDSKDFYETYPFITYQFKLLQDVFTDIRKHGYAGKHLSSGERSLLGAFQETAKRYGNEEMGVLIPFYAFYDTIEQFLEHRVKIVVKTANDIVKAGDLKEIDVKVLKLLFMMKNIKEIPSNIDNLSTLYVSSINDDKITIKKELSESLRRLERQTLIQRNNDEYRFLTDEEQEINREIKNIVIDQSKITDYMKKVIYDGIITDNKYVYKNRNFPITKYLDNVKYSQEYEIGIKIFVNGGEKNNSAMVMQSARENKFVFINLEVATLIYDEIVNYLQVEEYRRSKSGIMQSPAIEDILRAKQREVENTEIRIRENIRECLSESEIIINGDKQNINAKDVKARVDEAFEILVNNIFTKFSYIKHNFKTEDIRKLFKENDMTLLSSEVALVNQKAYEVMKDYCEEKNAFSFSLTIRELLQDFSKEPYGFLDEDILYLLTKLLKDEYVSLIYGNEVQNITMDSTLEKILKREYYDKTVIKIRRKIDLNLLNNLKTVARNSFNFIALRNDEDGMVSDFKNECLQKTINKIRSITPHYNIDNKYFYPGKELVFKVVETFEDLLKIKDIADFYVAIDVNKESIANISESLNLVFDFFEGSQKVQFDKATKAMNIYNNNELYVDKNSDLESIVNDLNEILMNDKPYSDIHKLPMLVSSLNDILLEMYDAKSKPLIGRVKDFISYITNECTNLNDEQISRNYIDNCNNIINLIEHSNELKDIYAQGENINQLKDKFINELDKLIVLIPSEELDTPSEKIIERKIIRSENILNKSFEINEEKDIDKYLDELKIKLVKEFEENKILIIR